MMFSHLCALGRAVDCIRRLIVNTVFFGALILLIVFGWWAIRPIEIENGTLLRIDIAGQVSETIPEMPKPYLRSLLGAEVEEGTRLRDVLDALDFAQKDPRIAGVMLNLTAMDSAGMASIREIGAAIDRYRKKSGKKVWVWDAAYSQSQYLIAAHADRISVHPMGSVMLKGLSSTALYWGHLLQTVGISVEVRKAGTFKSAPEILTSDRPSQESLAAQKSYMDEAWQGLCTDLEKRRGLMTGSVNTFIGALPKLAESERSLAQVFMDQGLVDAVETYEDFENRVAEAYSPSKRVTDLNVIDMQSFLSRHPGLPLAEHGVAVVIAEGEISSVPEAGGMTPDAVNALIDEVQDDPNVKALVLRVNSPGGDAVAAEMIRARLEKFCKEKQVPLVVSMGDAAASGGYWIATAGSHIVADPYTVTGSIGVFAMTFHAETLRKDFGIGRGGYRTTPLADFGMPLAEPSDYERAVIDGSVRRTYRDFKHFVGEARKMDPETVEKLAQGRVWIGSQAVRYGLADKIGGYSDAVAYARQLAKLATDAPIAVYEPASSGWQAFARSLLGATLGEGAVALLQKQSAVENVLMLSGRPLAWAPFVPTP